MKLLPSPPIRSTEKTRPVLGSTWPIGSDSTNCWTSGVETSSHRWSAGEETSSKLTRKVLGPDLKKVMPPWLTVPCLSEGTFTTWSMPIDGSPALSPRPAGERYVWKRAACGFGGGTGGTAGLGTNEAVAV